MTSPKSAHKPLHHVYKCVSKDREWMGTHGLAYLRISRMDTVTIAVCYASEATEEFPKHIIHVLEGQFDVMRMLVLPKPNMLTGLLTTRERPRWFEQSLSWTLGAKHSEILRPPDMHLFRRSDGTWAGFDVSEEPRGRVTHIPLEISQRNVFSSTWRWRRLEEEGLLLNEHQCYL